MNLQEAKELHDLLFSFMGLFHEKFMFKFRKQFDATPWMKKNHVKIINVLYQESPLISTEISKRLDIEKGSLTTLIDQLAEKGLVERQYDSKDRRKVLISLSPSGRDRMEKVMDYSTLKLAEIFRETDSKEVKQFITDLHNVVTFMVKIP